MRTRRTRTVFAVIACLAATALAGGLGTAGAETLATPVVSLTGPASVSVGTPAQLSVDVTAPSAAGEAVTLEKFGGLLWSAVDSTELDGASHATFAQTPTKTGDTKYRVRIAATSTHAAGTSATYTLSAVLATPTVTLTGPAEVVVNTPGIMTASVTALGAAGETVTLEKWGGLFWGSAGTAVLDASSQATFSKTPTAIGTTRYRVKIAKTATHNAVTSAEYVMNSVAEPPPPPPPAPDCGPTRLKPDGTPWVCTYNDDFSGTALDRNYWVPQRTANSNYANGYPTYTCYDDRPDVVSVSGGYLHLSMIELAQVTDCGAGKSSKYVAGSVSHYATFSQTYGMYEVRAKLPAVRDRGIQETFWLWPVNPVKYGNYKGSSGEIDFAEFYSRYPDDVIPYVHYASNEAGNDPDHTRICAINYDQFNNYRLEWYPGLLRIFVNDTLCMESHYQATNAPADHPYAPFDQPFFLALTQAMGASSTDPYADNTFDTNVIPDVVTTDIDYARIWK